MDSCSSDPAGVPERVSPATRPVVHVGLRHGVVPVVSGRTRRHRRDRRVSTPPPPADDPPPGRGQRQVGGVRTPEGHVEGVRTRRPEGRCRHPTFGGGRRPRGPRVGPRRRKSGTSSTVVVPAGAATFASKSA